MTVLVEVINAKVHFRRARATLRMLVDVVRKRRMVYMSSEMEVDWPERRVLVRVAIDRVIVLDRRQQPDPTNAKVGDYALTVIPVSTLAYSGRKS